MVRQVQGVSTRLGNPDPVKRKQGMRIGRMFSTIAGFAAPSDLTTDDLDPERQAPQQGPPAPEKSAASEDPADVLFKDEDLDMEAAEVWWSRPGTVGSAGGGALAWEELSNGAQDGSAWSAGDDVGGAGAEGPVRRKPGVYGRAVHATASVLKVRCSYPRTPRPCIVCIL